MCQLRLYLRCVAVSRSMRGADPRTGVSAGSTSSSSSTRYLLARLLERLDTPGHSKGHELIDGARMLLQRAAGHRADTLSVLSRGAGKTSSTAATPSFMYQKMSVEATPHGLLGARLRDAFPDESASISDLLREGPTFLPHFVKRPWETTRILPEAEFDAIVGRYKGTTARIGVCAAQQQWRSARSRPRSSNECTW